MKESQYIELFHRFEDYIFALAPISNPDIIFLDEPTADLMSKEDYPSMNKLESSNHRARQLFWQATIWPKLKPYVTALLFLNSGKIVFCGTPSELTDRLGRKYFIHLKTQDGEKSLETDTIEDTLWISLLEECEQKHIQILDIKVDRGTLEHFTEMAREGIE